MSDRPEFVSPNRFAESLRLFERASTVIPGGIYGHVSPSLLEPGASPYFASRAEGAHYWDVDGNRYLDFMCGYGPVVLGHGHPEVEAAAEEARRGGICFNHPTELTVQLAEKIVELVDFAAWAVFAKNGSDVTTWCTQVVREYTGRSKVLCAEGAYHGSAPWCTPGHGGLTHTDKAHIARFRWNDPQSVEDLFTTHQDAVAAVLVTPFHHPLFHGSEQPSKEFIDTIHGLCERHESLLILDDIRAGFRVHLGGSHVVYGWRPDMACYSKAMANGHPISAAVGRAELKAAASKVFLTGSFWNGPAEMAAALKSIEIIQRDAIIERIRRSGETMRAGWIAAANKQGQDIQWSGPPGLPHMRFASDSGYSRRHAFCKYCYANGLFIHPHHNWFVSGAHSDEDIAESIQVAAAGFAQLEALIEKNSG